MGCDIHLRLERKLRQDKKWNEYYTEKADRWKSCGIFGFRNTWGDRIYGMFAVLADVRNHYDFEHLPLRGMPEDATIQTLQCYGLRVSDEEKEGYYDWECSRKNAERWVNEGYSQCFGIEGTEYISGPDWHSPNWCTTQEMEDCINKVFKDENGNWQGDYIEWLALL